MLNERSYFITIFLRSSDSFLHAFRVVNAHEGQYNSEIIVLFSTLRSSHNFAISGSSTVIVDSNRRRRMHRITPGHEFLSRFPCIFSNASP